MTYGGMFRYDGAVIETAANSGRRKRTEILNEGKFLSEPKFLISSRRHRFVAQRTIRHQAGCRDRTRDEGIQASMDADFWRMTMDNTSPIPRKQRFRLHEIDAVLRAAGGVYAHAARLLSEATGRSCTRQNI